jgi:general secretion pathway protein G
MKVHEQRMLKAYKALRGFSLIEIMVVVTLMGILMTIATVYFMGRLEEGRIQTARTQVHEISNALDLYKLSHGSYPTSAEGLDILIHPTRGQPMMQKLPLDPWNRSYNYEIPGSHNPKGFDVWSEGPNGEGGEEAIGNWSVEEPKD